MSTDHIWLALLTLALFIGYAKIVTLSARVENLPTNSDHGETNTRLARLEARMEHLTNSIEQVMQLLIKGDR